MQQTKIAGKIESRLSSPRMQATAQGCVPVMRHTHATHALQRGAELTTVRDKLRHASLWTTSMYPHSDDLRRAKQIGGAFEAPSGSSAGAG